MKHRQMLHISGLIVGLLACAGVVVWLLNPARRHFKADDLLVASPDSVRAVTLHLGGIPGKEIYGSEAPEDIDVCVRAAQQATYIWGLESFLGRTNDSLYFYGPGKKLQRLSLKVSLGGAYGGPLSTRCAALLMTRRRFRDSAEWKYWYEALRGTIPPPAAEPTAP